MTVAMQNSKVGAPGAYGFAVLMSKNPGELVEMCEVVSSPCRKKLGEGHRAEYGMAPTQLKVGRGEMKRVKLGQVVRTKTSEIVEQLGERLALAFSLLTETIEGLKGRKLGGMAASCGYEEPRTGHPIGALSVSEMTNDVEGSPAVVTFVPMRPRVGKVTKQGIKRDWSAAQESDGLLKVVGHRVSRSVLDCRPAPSVLKSEGSIKGVQGGERYEIDMAATDSWDGTRYVCRICSR